MASEEPTPAAPPAEDAAPAQAADDKETADAAPAAATDAPASKTKPASKKASSAKPPAKARASTGGAPKKGVAAADTGSKSFKVGETVLARLKGYPPWPARIADPESVPRGVASQRPGKGPQIYCVNYFPAGDFSWLNARDITKLSKDDISSFLSAGHRKASGGLKEAYETAADPEEWIAAQEELLRSREEDEREAAENVDELEDEDETPAGGKRKRGAASKPVQKKKAKKADADDAPKSKAKATKKSAAPASVPEDKAPADDDPLASDPECVKVKDWRHKLQRAFLGKGLPSATEMDQYNDVFNSIEAYKDMTIEALQYSKIGKVMKKIAALDAIPRNDELKITERAAKLMDDWHNFISGTAGGEKTNGDAPKSEAPKSAGKAAAPAEKKEDESKEANGASAEDEKKDDKMEVEAEA